MFLFLDTSYSPSGFPSLHFLHSLVPDIFSALIISCSTSLSYSSLPLLCYTIFPIFRLYGKYRTEMPLFASCAATGAHPLQACLQVRIARGSVQQSKRKELSKKQPWHLKGKGYSLTLSPALPCSCSCSFLLSLPSSILLNLPSSHTSIIPPLLTIASKASSPLFPSLYNTPSPHNCE